ncbi:4-vinyl reductase [Hippea alviniae]|uniref:4-vinyl reductase n=1 Tax=Hippea alviniae TaxID=1279027 RepID=UPI0003B4BEAF|nr:4-vinyl reductase [Hippea alviniae]
METKRLNDKDVEKCLDVDTKCVLNHICYKYSAMVMAGLIEALDYFGGSQGSKVLRRLLAKKIPMEMMKAMDIDPTMLSKFSEEEILKILPEIIYSKGGPKLTIEKIDDGSYRFTLNECHFLPYSKSKGFCNVTAGLMLGFAQMLSGKAMDIEEVQTIAKGGEICEFIAKPKFGGKK